MDDLAQIAVAVSLPVHLVLCFAGRARAPFVVEGCKQVADQNVAACAMRDFFGRKCSYYSSCSCCRSCCRPIWRWCLFVRATAVVVPIVDVVVALVVFPLLCLLSF